MVLSIESQLSCTPCHKASDILRRENFFVKFLNAQVFFRDIFKTFIRIGIVMKVSTRVGGGFSLLCLLTLALGYVSWSSITSIREQVDISTQQTGPMVRDSSVLVSELREAYNLALHFLVSRD